MFDIDPEDFEPCSITVLSTGKFGTRVLTELQRNPQKVEYFSLDNNYPEATAHAANSDLLFLVIDPDCSVSATAIREIATTAKTAGCLVVAITRVALFSENQHYFEVLQQEVDVLIPVSTKCLMPLEVLPESLLSDHAIETYVACGIIRQISLLITERGIICIDFANIKTILGRSGKFAAVGIGMANGDNRGTKAAVKALQAFSRKRIVLSHSSGILATITGSSNLTMEDYNEAVRAIHENVPEEVHILVAITVDEAFGENVRVMVVGKNENL